MDRQRVADWIAAYERAWRSPGTAALATIFTPDVTYRQGPYKEPVVGLPALATMWEAQRDGPDEEFRMTAEVVAVDADTAVARIHVRYGDPVDTEYRDLWIMRFADDGRCSSFEEWPFFPAQPIQDPAAPPPDSSTVDAEHAQHHVDAYIDAWNEPRADRREQLLTRVLSDDCVYVDPNTEQHGRAGLAQYIGGVLDRYPGRRIVRTSEVDVHHRHCRFTWRLIKPDGTSGVESVDYVEFADDGTLHRVTGFFGPVTPGGAP